MPKKSAGILMYRRTGETIEVLLVHPGGPLWAKKDAGAWSIPKGEIEVGEDPLTVARKEFQEETGCSIEGTLIPLPDITQRGGKVVSIWAVEGTCDADAIRSNTFSMEWPPRSGRTAEFPEVDRAGWFAPDASRVKLNPAQVSVVDALCDYLGVTRQVARAGSRSEDGADPLYRAPIRQEGASALSGHVPGARASRTTPHRR